MKQTIQQTAVQRAVQPVARPIPMGLEQFDMAAGDEAVNTQDKVDENAVGYERFKGLRAKTRARLVSISEDELATPGQIDAMMALGSSAASSSGYDAGSSADIVPVRVRTQEFEALTISSVRGTPRVVGHSRTDSTASTASAASAVSTATTVAIPPHIRQQSDIDILVEVSKERQMILNQKNTVEDCQLAMEITALSLIIGKT